MKKADPAGADTAVRDSDLRTAGRYQLTPIVGRKTVFRETDADGSAPVQAQSNQDFRLGILKEIKKFSRIVKEFGCDEYGNLQHIRLNGGQTIYFDRFNDEGVPLDFRRTFTDGTELVYTDGQFDPDRSTFKTDETRKLLATQQNDDQFLQVSKLFNVAMSSQDIVLFDMQNLKPSFLNLCTYSGTIVLPFGMLQQTKETTPGRSIRIVNALEALRFKNVAITMRKDVSLYKVAEGIKFNDVTANLHRMYSDEGMDRAESHPWLSWCLYGDQLSDVGHDVYRELEKKCELIYQQALQKKGLIRYNDTITPVPIKVWLDKESGTYELLQKVTIPAGEKVVLSQADEMYAGIFSVGRLYFTKDQLLDLFKRDMITIGEDT
jgi:hypothetical protein